MQSQSARCLPPNDGQRYRAYVGPLAPSAFCNPAKPCACFLFGDATEIEKSTINRTVLGQNRHGVSCTSGSPSSPTLIGKERRHSVHVTTMNGTPFESLPLRGIQT